MRTIKRSTAFRRDFKREKKGQHGKSLDALLASTLTLLLADQPLPQAMQDHPLTGEWKGYRDCHLKPDLVLIYAKPDAATLALVRLGSHSELFE